MLLQAHSGFRYLVLLAGIIVILYAAYGLATKRKYGTRMRVLSGVFTGIVDQLVYTKTTTKTRTPDPHSGARLNTPAL